MSPIKEASKSIVDIVQHSLSSRNSKTYATSFDAIGSDVSVAPQGQSDRSSHHLQLALPLAVASVPTAPWAYRSCPPRLLSSSDRIASRSSDGL